jgi:hypothetical protein
MLGSNCHTIKFYDFALFACGNILYFFFFFFRIHDVDLFKISLIFHISTDLVQVMVAASTEMATLVMVLWWHWRWCLVVVVVV